MRRREFIGLLGGAVAWPLAAEAQQKLPIIGFLDSYTPVPPGPPELFRNGLKEVGYVEGQNVAFEYRSAMGHYDRLNALADELVRLHVSLIAAYGNRLPSRQRLPQILSQLSFGPVAIQSRTDRS